MIRTIFVINIKDMNAQVLENPVKNLQNTHLDITIKEVTNHGIVNFSESKEQNVTNPFWDGKKLTIPVYGVYKISWGFYQKSLETFYKDLETKLALVVNNKAHEEKAIITKETPCFHAVKSSHKSITLLLRENETICLHPEILNSERPDMKDVYLKVERLYSEENATFMYKS